jgi:hypothetical protein
MSKTRSCLHIFSKKLINFISSTNKKFAITHISLFLKVVHKMKDSLKNNDFFYFVNKYIQWLY